MSDQPLEPEPAPAVEPVVEPELAPEPAPEPEPPYREDIDLDVLGKLIEPTDVQAQDRARRRLEASTRGPRLGRLLELAQWWAAVRGDDTAPAPQRIRHIGVDVPLPDQAALPDHPGPSHRPASQEQVDAALEWGVATADAAADAGVDLLVLTADDPIGARLVAAELMGLDAVEANAWPQDRDMDDDAWMDELLVLRDGLRRTSALRGDPVALLRAVGSVRIAAAAAVVVQATARRTPVLLDGPGASAAALLARRTAYVANQWWQAAQASPEPLHARTLTSLNLEPLVSLRIAVEDGTAARLGLDVLRVAAEQLTRDTP